MFLSTWLLNRKKSLASWLAQPQTQRQRSSAHPFARTLLWLEVLEDRIAPSGFQSLYSFTGGNDGKNPYDAVIVDSKGNLDGTTFNANIFGGGSVFQFNPSTKGMTILHPFSFNAEYWAEAGLIQDSSGNFYGTTRASSNGGGGSVYKLSPDGKTFTVLHNFSPYNGDGWDPYANLVMDAKGNLYGTTSNGGTNGLGTVFEVSPTPSAEYKTSILYSFTGKDDGWNLQTPLLIDGNGDLYGTADSGGANSDGTVFELSPNGSGGYTFTTLHAFDGNDGNFPLSGLIMNSNGNLCGTSVEGPAGGQVFELNPSSKVFTIIHTFQYSDGYGPSGNLILDSKGDIYGTNQQGGTYNQGTVYELSPNGSGGYNVTVLHSFNGSQGEGPFGGLSVDSNGNLYGTTLFGGSNGDGTIFELPGVISVISATTTTASNAQAYFSPNQQSVNLTATVSSSAAVNEGTVTFSVYQGTTLIGTATTSSTVSNGQGSVSYALPANLLPGNYTIDAVYNPGPDFSGSSDNTHTLTVSPANVTTTANGVTATYDTKSKTLSLSAKVADDSISTDTVGEGSVTFTIDDSSGKQVGNSVAGAVTGGAASAQFAWPAGQAAGNYTIAVAYTDSKNAIGTYDFTDFSDVSGTLKIQSAGVAVKAASLQTPYSSQQQTVKLNATVTDDFDTSNIVGEGVVTFTVLNGTVTIGTVQSAVSNGAASTNFTLAAGQPPASYTIDVAYSDSSGNFSDDLSDASSTLKVTAAGVIVTASNASTVYRVGPQTVKFSATVADTSVPTDTVSEGIVTFTVLDGQTLNSAQGVVSGGVATAVFQLASGLAAGSYIIDVGYSDAAGKFASYNTTAALAVAPASVTTVASSVAAGYRTTTQSVALSAAVSNAATPSDTVREGSVTFTILDSKGNSVGSVQGAVSDGVANANFNLTAGQAAGTYTIAVSYSDSKNANQLYNFIDTGDTSGTLKLNSSNVVTTASAASLTFNPAAQTVNLSAAVADASNSSDPVGAGTVTFTVEQIETSQTIVVGTASAAVTACTPSGGTANATFDWTAARPAGSYTILVSYADSKKNYTDNGDTSSTLIVATAPVTVTGENASALYTLSTQTVTLNATVSGTNDAGAVVFTVEKGNTVVGTAQGAVSNSAAFAHFALPAGLAAGSYAIAAHYTDINGNYSDAGDTNGTLTIAPANVVTTASSVSVNLATAQSATLSACVANTSNPSDTVGEGSVTFTVLDGEGKQIGTAQGTVTSGTASASFSLSGVASGNYTVSVSYSDSNGNFSDAGDTSGTLAVLQAPKVTTNPSNETAPAGVAAVFTAAASGNPTPTVQWQITTDGGKTWTAISGATSTTLTLQNVQTSQSGDEYQAVFSNSLGSVTSSAATLTVPIAPIVTSNPSNQTVSAGSNAAFTAGATGGPAPTVQWQVSTDGGATWTPISGATSTTLSLSNVQAPQNGSEYQAVFTNVAGAVVTSAATLTVQYAPTVTSNPSNQTALAGQEATFTAAAGGNPAPGVQWQVSSDGGKTFTEISGAISPTLTLAGLTAAMNGNEYQAVFTNSQGSATTSAATLTVNGATVPVVTLNPTSQTAAAGTTVTFTVSASGSPTPTVQWQVSTNGGATFTNINGATNPTLTLTDVAPGMNGWRFQAVLSNSGGSTVSGVASLTVSTSPSSSSSSSQSLVLNVPPLLALLGEFLSAVETANANNTETVVYSLFGIPLASANYDGSGDFMDAALMGFFIPNWVWYL